MRQNENRKGSPLIGAVILAAIGAVNVLGFAGLILIATVVMVGVVFWAAAKSVRQQANTDDDARRTMRRPEVRRYPMQESATVGGRREEYQRRTEELQDLLHAGIIEQPEYHDRMAQLRNGGF